MQVHIYVVYIPGTRQLCMVIHAECRHINLKFCVNFEYFLDYVITSLSLPHDNKNTRYISKYHLFCALTEQINPYKKKTLPNEYPLFSLYLFRNNIRPGLMQSLHCFNDFPIVLLSNLNLFLYSRFHQSDLYQSK